MLTQINFVPGDVVRVSEKIKEGDPSADSASSLQAGSGQVKTRIQVFQGTVLGIRGRGDDKSFSVLKMVGDVSVEKTWPLMSPNLEKVEVKEHSKKRVRHAKLYFTRLPRKNP